MTFDSRLGSHLLPPRARGNWAGIRAREKIGGRNRQEMSGGRPPPRPPQEPSVHNPASLTRPAEIVAAWSVEDGVRVVWEVAKMVVVVVVKVVLLVWIQNNDREKKNG